jgi:hypothetical protein
MGQRSDPAGALHKMMGIPGIPAQQNQFDAPKHLRAAPGVDHFPSGHLYFNAKVAFYSGNRINGDSISHEVSSLSF